VTRLSWHDQAVPWQERSRRGTHWFETDTAQRFDLDGRVLWRTAKGRWILQQGDRWQTVCAEEASALLLRCGTPEALGALKQYLLRARHRKPRGLETRIIGLPEHYWAGAQEAANEAQVSRSAWIRWVISGGVRAAETEGLVLAGGPGDLVSWRAAGMSHEVMARRLSAESGLGVSASAVRRRLLELGVSGRCLPAGRRRHVVVPDELWGRVVAAAGAEFLSSPQWVRLLLGRALDSDG